MQRALGPFEVPLGDMEFLGTDDSDRYRHRFLLRRNNDKLVPGMECSLRAEGREDLVTVIGLERLAVLLACGRRLTFAGESATLVIYPWFLYERLIASLESLLESRSHYPERSLSVFGRHPSQHEAMQLREDHGGLNDSQIEALRLCCSGSLAFVWGPPGTGKTTTLAHVVEELVSQGLRVLVTSTTNAAIDQALAALVQRPTVEALLKHGEILRIGRSEAETYGADIVETVKRLSSSTRDQVRTLHQEKERTVGLARSTEDLLAVLEATGGSTQLTLFEELPAEGLDAARLSGILPEPEIPLFLELPASEQMDKLRGLATELGTRASDIDERMAALEREGYAREADVIARAGVILATMAAVYVNQGLAAERFDTVVIDEAGMAVLPAVFYCASLGREKTILIGDPRQLPSIVHSDDAYVRKAMARSVFEVAVPDIDPRLSRVSEHLSLLDVQYRMHPAIGDLVSGLYYDGRLRNASITDERNSIAAKTPFPDAPLVLLDSGDYGRCETPPGSYSRYNRTTAELCVMLADSAIRGGLSSVAVITPYVEQSRLVRTLLTDRRFRDVECSTVHRFQGHEKDLIILDTVDGEPHKPGVLLVGDGVGSSAANLLNVSISRARGKLVVVSSLAYFRTHAPGTPIARLLEAVAARGLVINAGHAEAAKHRQTLGGDKGQSEVDSPLTFQE